MGHYQQECYTVASQVGYLEQLNQADPGRWTWLPAEAAVKWNVRQGCYQNVNDNQRFHGWKDIHMSHVRGRYTIRHLLIQHDAEIGYKFGIHVLPASNLSTELIDLLLHVLINGSRIVYSLQERRHVALRL